jgi:hypothetical protein
MSIPPDQSAALSLVIVGAGPGAAGLLERIAANLPELALDRPLWIHLVDPYPPGAGRVWRDAQSPLLWMNSMAEDVTMFTDESVRCAGPIRPGPSLIEWAERARRAGAGAEPSTVDIEVATMTGDSFPSRRVQARYLDWFFWQAAGALPATARVRVHPTTVVDVTGGPAERQVVHLADGAELPADLVVLSLGHLDAEPDAEQAALREFAAGHGLTYLPRAYTADADLADLAPGQPVLVRGLGLAFIDLIVLLSQGRGGQFVPAGGGRLRYLPSGKEPHLYAGSRRGVPYHSKTTYPLPGARPPLPHFLDAGAIAALRARPERLDFRRDVWPLVAKEAGWGHYHELFASHPDRVRLPWAEFAARYSALAWNEPAMAELVAAAVPDRADRLDLARLDRPLAGSAAETLAEQQDVVRAYIRADIDRRSDVTHSADLGAFYALLITYGQLGLLADRITAASRLADLEQWWHGFFSFMASGPPPYRLEQLLALSEAGLVTFLPPDMRITADAERGVFRASAPGVVDRVEAGALVEARLPQPHLPLTRSALLQSLYARGDVVEEELADDDAGLRTGRMLVTPDGRLIDRAGRAHPRRYALGFFTSNRTLAAFARPGTNSPGFRHADLVARALLTALRAESPCLTSTGDPG